MKYFLINILLTFLPSSRFFGFKRNLLRFCGAVIAKDVRVMKIRVLGVRLEVGEDTFIGDETLIMGTENTNVIIGKNCDISSRVSIVTGTHHLGNIERAAGIGYGEDIIIEDGVWIGFGAVILSGVKIGKGAIIAAGSVVTNDIPSAYLAAGVPAICKKSLYL